MIPVRIAWLGFLANCAGSFVLALGQDRGYVSAPETSVSISQQPSATSAEVDSVAEERLTASERPLNTATSAAEIIDLDELASRIDQLEMATAKAKPNSNSWTVNLGGIVHLDYINWANADSAIPDAQDYFEFRRLRLVADGVGYDVLDFRLQIAFEPESIGDTTTVSTISSADVKDAYLSLNEIPLFGRFRIGHFFVPFSLEQVTVSPNLSFLERSIPSQGIFTVDREVGLALYNCTEDMNLSWSYGLFFDGISEALKDRVDDNQGLRLSSRITGLPYYDEASNGRYLVHLGLGVLHTDDQNGVVRFRTRPHIHEGPRLIDSGEIDADAFTTANLESAIVWGPLTIHSEAYLSSIDRKQGGATTIGGAFVHCSYFLTGENRVYEKFGRHAAQFGRTKPKHNFALSRHGNGAGWGAWEAKARWSNLDLSGLDSGQYNDLTVGMNWYWNDRTRVLFDWIHPITSSASRFGNTTADLLGMRFEFNW